MKRIRTRTSLVLTLLAGAACLAASYLAFTGVAPADLHLQLLHIPESRRLVIRLVNIGRRDVVVDLAGMEFLIQPSRREKGRFTLRLASTPDPGRSSSQSVVLKPGDSRDLFDAMPHLRGLPPGENVLAADYTSRHPREGRFWSGTVRAFPVPITVVGRSPAGAGTRGGA